MLVIDRLRRPLGKLVRAVALAIVAGLTLAGLALGAAGNCGRNW